MRQQHSPENLTPIWVHWRVLVTGRCSMVLSIRPLLRSNGHAGLSQTFDAIFSTTSPAPVRALLNFKVSYLQLYNLYEPHILENVKQRIR